MRVALFAILAPAAVAFNFGGFSLPSLPAGLPTALPSLPALPDGFNLQSLLPSAIVELPSAFYESALPAFPTAIPDISLPAFPTLGGGYGIQSRLPYISVPPLPSFDLSTELPSLPAIPSELAGAVASRLLDINNELASAGFSQLPTNPVGAIASLRGAIASIREQLGDGRDGLQKIADSYMNSTSRNFTVPASEAELREILEGRGGFNMERADAILDDLGSKTGQDVHGSVRMIAALVLQNSTQPQIFTRVTQEFTMHAVRVREGAEQAFNFTASQGLSQIHLPALDLQNKTLSVIQYASNPYQFLSGQRINSQVVSIMIADLAGNETQVRDLQNTINFTLPLNVSDSGVRDPTLSGASGSYDAEYNALADVACVYWDSATSAWQTDGCTLIELLPAEARCACTHLTDFAIATVVAVVAVVASPTPFVVAVASPSVAPLAATLTASVSSWMTPAVTSPRQPIVQLDADTSSSGKTPLGTIVGASIGGIVAVGAIALIAANWFHYRHKRAAKRAVKSITNVSPIKNNWV